MNICAMANRGLLALFILGGAQLIAMNVAIKDATIQLNFQRSMASWQLIGQYEKWIRDNMNECIKKYQPNAVDPKVVHNNLILCNNLNFWNTELTALNFTVSTAGLVDAGLKIEEHQRPLQHETLFRARWELEDIIANKTINSPHGVKRKFNGIKEGQGNSETKRLKTNQSSYKKIYQ